MERKPILSSAEIHLLLDTSDICTPLDNSFIITNTHGSSQAAQTEFLTPNGLSYVTNARPGTAISGLTYDWPEIKTLVSLDCLGQGLGQHRLTRTAGLLNSHAASGVLATRQNSAVKSDKWQRIKPHRRPLSPAPGSFTAGRVVSTAL